MLNIPHSNTKYTIFQKDPFCPLKGLLLHSKRTPFALQNESFWNAKRVLFLGNYIFNLFNTLFR